MSPNELDRLLLAAMQTEDDSFSECVLQRLPAPREPMFQKWQWYLWSVTAASVLAIIVLATRSADFSGMTNPSYMIVGLISLVLVWVHFEESTV